MIDFGYGVFLDSIDDRYSDYYRSWRNDPRIRSWCRQYTLISYEDQKNWLEKQQADPTIKMFSIYTKDDMVGVCGLTSIDLINRRAEFSLYINPEEQGKGHAKAALKTLFAHGFRDFGLNVIWGETFDGNPAAKMFEKLGMKREGTRREFYFRDGKFIDCHLYSITAHEFGCAHEANQKPDDKTWIRPGPRGGPSDVFQAAFKIKSQHSSGYD